jgi:hypothetical protein
MFKKKLSSGRKVPRLLSDRTEVPFKVLFSFNASSSGFSLGSFDLDPANMGNRINTFATLYKRWRIKRMRVEAKTDSISVEVAGSAGGLTVASGFYGAPLASQGSPPTSIADIVSLVDADFGPSQAAYSVPPSVLEQARGGAVWLLVFGTGSEPAGLISQGAVQTGLQLGQSISTGSVRVNTVVTGIAEFCEPTNPSLSLFSKNGADADEGFVPLDDDEKETTEEVSVPSLKSHTPLKCATSRVRR